MKNEEQKLQSLAEPLVSWYRENARKLPWREGKNPYHIWLSEIMLQQTRVEAVKDYYARFLDTLPTVSALAEVGEEELMKLWQGLGYYNRARNLKRAAEIIVSEYDGRFPDTYEVLLQLPGIGEYTAGAIASIAFDRRVPAVDGNVYRIYSRIFAYEKDIMASASRKEIREKIEKIVPAKEPGAFNQAWMDLGATVCIPNGEPHCDICPLNSFCSSYQNHTQSDYPVKKKKKPRKIEERTVFLLEYQGKYLIQKRPPKGLLAGLWEFPSQEGKMSVTEVTKQLDSLEMDHDSLELLGIGKHIFSHVEWHMIGYLIHLKELTDHFSDTMVLADKGELEKKYSIPSAFAVYLSQIL